MKKNIEELFDDFVKQNRFRTKGPLCVGLTVTRYAISEGLPKNADELLTEKGGQVSTLGKSQVQKILNDYGITKVLAEEGGRTSRGSIDNMRKYVDFLKNLSPNQADLKRIEELWIERVKAFFAQKPFRLNFDAAKSMRSIVRDLLNQAERRQSENPGTTIVGTVLQHLVGAKLDVLTLGKVEHHGANEADEQSGRDGDFLLDDVSIHVTSSPNEALLRKCGRNLHSGLRPIIVTKGKGLQIAEWLVEQSGLEERIEIFDAEQFLAGNFYELGAFVKSKRKIVAETIINKYNELIDRYENNPSLKVEL